MAEKTITKTEGKIQIAYSEESTNHDENKQIYPTTGKRVYTNDNETKRINTLLRRQVTIARISLTNVEIPAHTNITETYPVKFTFKDITGYTHNIIIPDTSEDLQKEILSQVSPAFVYDEELFCNFIRLIISNVYNDEDVISELELYVAPEPDTDSTNDEPTTEEPNTDDNNTENTEQNP